MHDCESGEQLRRDEAAFHHNIAVRRAAKAGKDAVYALLVREPFEAPDDPLAVLVRVRHELAQFVAGALTDGGYNIPVTWLEEITNALQIAMPSHEHIFGK